jgi:glycosyltransferase involved in cell wall biosynthesis
VTIQLVTTYFWPETFRINDLVRAWTERGHEVRVLTAMPNYPAGRLFPGYTWRGPYRERHAGAGVQRVPIITRGPHRGVRLVANYLSFVVSASIAGLASIHRRPDVIFVYEPSPITVCLPAIALRRRWRTPLALWVQDLWPENLSATGAVRSTRALQAAGRLCRWIYRHCDLVLAQSPGFVDPIRTLCPDVRAIEVLPNWADGIYQPVDVPADAPERAELPSGFTIVYAGNIGSAQGLGIVLDAADELRGEDIHWAFIGDGNDRQRLEGETARRGLGDAIRFLGWRPNEAMPRYLSLADALLISLRRGGGFAPTIPAKVQSALAMGRPILAALEGEGARVILESGAGPVVDPENATALAAGARALRDASAAARGVMGQRGRDYALRHFDRDTLVGRLDGWLRNLAEERS